MRAVGHWLPRIVRFRTKVIRRIIGAGGGLAGAIGLFYLLPAMTRDEYMRHAEECEQLATIAKMPSNRMALLESAHMWRKLADNAAPEDGAGPNPQIPIAPGT